MKAFLTFIFKNFPNYKSKITGFFRNMYESCSLYSHLDRKFNSNKENYDIAGVYILFFLLLIIMLIILCQVPYIKLIALFVGFVVSIYRLFDILGYYFEMFIFHQKDGHVYVDNCARTFFYAMLNFIEIILYLTFINFALTFWGARFENIAQPSFLESLYSIFLVFGFGEICPVNLGAKLFVLFQMGYIAIVLFFFLPIFVSVIKLERKESG